MIPRHVNNPFLRDELDNTHKLPAGHVPELHTALLAQFERSLADTRRTGHCIRVLVKGETGTGKTHAITQYREQLVADKQAVLVTVGLKRAHVGRLWRHTREQVVEELLRQYPDPKAGGNGLLRILRNRFPTWASAAQGASGGLLDWLVGRSRPGTDLQPHLNEFAQTVSLDYGLQKVLPKVAHPQLSLLAHNWLRGGHLSEDDLRALQLPPDTLSDHELEAAAQRVVLSLLRLAGDRTTVILCFDELEALLSGMDDAVAFRQLATMLTDLLAEAGPRVLVTLVRPNVLSEMLRFVEVSNMRKISQHEVTVPPLNWEQTIRVVRARLEAEPTCRAERLKHLDDPDWPLGQQFLLSTFNRLKRSLTPRHLIIACRTEFNRLQQGGGGDEDGKVIGDDSPGTPDSQRVKVGPGSPLSVGEPKPLSGAAFNAAWEKVVKQGLKNPHALQFDTVIALALPWLVKLMGLPLVLAEDEHKLDNVNLLFRSTSWGAKPVGISFCNHPPAQLNPRVKKLAKVWETAKGTQLGSLVALRLEGEHTTEVNKRNLGDLEKAGARVLWVALQQLVELSAFQTMMTYSRRGILTHAGRPIETPEYEAWARDALSASVKEFLDSVFGSYTSGTAPAKQAAPVPQPAPAPTQRKRKASK